jgi:nucleoside-diphosphate-sugar epimerase
LKSYIQALDGPIFVIGAGGFIGINLFNEIFKIRKDVYAVSQNARNNWRLNVNNVPTENIISCDIKKYVELKYFINAIKPKTIFNLAAYGAYSKQQEYNKIYDTNLKSTVDIIELLKQSGFSAYIHAGSSSEYGTNSASPSEVSTLNPNSHYAVSKIAAFYALNFYGNIERLPVSHLRLYSAYGPWEEPDRLIPTLVSKARKKSYPSFVDRNISRDFVHVSDVCNAFILAAINISNIRGEVFNIGSGIKTTIGQLAELIKKEFAIQETPTFSVMPNRDWDVLDWYSNSSKAEEILGWRSIIELGQGIIQVSEWQKEVDYDNAYWNFNK